MIRSTLIVLGLTLMSLAGSAQTVPARVFEIRTYTTAEGKLETLKKRFRDHTIRIFDKHAITSIGYWVPQDAPRSQDTLIYIVSHPSREAAKANWAAFGADPEWRKVQTASEADGKIVTKVESIFVDSTDFSPLK
jgi:hypothetical protein